MYIGVNSIDDTLTRIEQFGGEIEKPRFEVLGVAILGLFRDPAGNPMGLVELDSTGVKVPQTE